MPSFAEQHPDVYARLLELAREFKAANPTLHTLVHTGAVWFRHGGRDWGIYSYAHGGPGAIVAVMEGTRCYLHAPSGEAPADAVTIA